MTCFLEITCAANMCVGDGACVVVASDGSLMCTYGNTEDQCSAPSVWCDGSKCTIYIPCSRVYPLRFMYKICFFLSPKL